MTKQHHLQALPGYPPETGRWLWALQELRARTLKLVNGLGQSELDWQGPDGKENAVGSLLYHIGLVEVSWLFLDVLEREFPPEVQGDFPYPMATEGRITPVLGEPAAGHVDRLARSRAVFLHMFKSISAEDWDRLRSPQGTKYQVSPAWAVFHLVEHEAGHAGQISAMKARLGRLGG